MSGAVPPHPAYAFMMCTRSNFPFCSYSKTSKLIDLFMYILSACVTCDQAALSTGLLLYKSFWVFTRSRYLVWDQRFGTDQITTPSKKSKNFYTSRQQRRKPSIVCRSTAALVWICRRRNEVIICVRLPVMTRILSLRTPKGLWRCTDY
jgi:hypothetical protein